MDRLVCRDGIQRRLTDSVETALHLAAGLVIALAADASGERQVSFSQNYACDDCGISIDELTPRLFSFNNPFGACPKCGGLGIQLQIDPARVVPDASLSVLDGAITATGWNNVREDSIARMYFEALAKRYHFSFRSPRRFGELPEAARDAILYGTHGEKLELVYERRNGTGRLQQPFEGVINNLQRRYTETQSAAVRDELEQCMSEIPCPECHGRRLKKEALVVTVGGLGIIDFTERSIEEEIAFLDTLQLHGQKQMIAEQIVREIHARLDFLRSVGLSYLTLSRAAGTLSGGRRSASASRPRSAPGSGRALILAKLIGCTTRNAKCGRADARSRQHADVVEQAERSTRG